MTTTRPGLLLDIDGVLLMQGQAIDGAAESVRRLREAGHAIHLVTNTTSRARSVLVDELRAAGIDVTADDLLNPMVAAADWIRRKDLEPAALFVPDAAREDFGELTTADTGVRSVVIGDLRERWSWTTMNAVLRHLLHDDACTLVALGRTRYWRADDGFALDVGPFAAAFEMATGRPAVVLGKPDPGFFHLACARIDHAPEDVIMVGDDVRSDVGAAIDAGLGGILVRTGKFRPSDLAGDVRPDRVIDSIVDLPRVV